LLRRAAQRAQQAFPDLRIETDLICEDDPANVLRSLAAEGALVVLGTHGRGLVAGALSGSVARGVMWELSGPVCVVPDAEHRPPE
jgi:nucleotide-binding universal stress UspA family protein